MNPSRFSGDEWPTANLAMDPTGLNYPAPCERLYAGGSSPSR
jgi:hypothetical protein